MVNLVCCSISGGLVALPATFQRIGLLPAVFTLIVAWLTTFCSMILVAALVHQTGCRDFGDVAIAVGGPATGSMVDLFLSALLTGVVTGGLIIVREFFRGCVPSYYELLTIVTVVGVVLPLSLPRTIGCVGRASSFSLVAFSFLVFIVLGYGIAELAAGSSTTHWWPDETPALVDVVVCFNTFIYAFACQVQLPPIFYDFTDRDSRDRGVDRLSPSTLASFVTVALGASTLQASLFTALGFMGVVAFPGQHVNSDILVTLNSKPLGGLAHGCLIVATVLATPLILFPARASVCSLVASCGARYRQHCAQRDRDQLITSATFGATPPPLSIGTHRAAPPSPGIISVTRTRSQK